MLLRLDVLLLLDVIMCKLPRRPMVAPPLPPVLMPLVVVSKRDKSPFIPPNDCREDRLEDLDCGSLIVERVDNIAFTSDSVAADFSVTDGILLLEVLVPLVVLEVPFSREEEVLLVRLSSSLLKDFMLFPFKLLLLPCVVVLPSMLLLSIT